MKVKRINEAEGAMLNILYEIAPLEWRRFQKKYSEVWVNDHYEVEDNSIYPPYVAFRFVNESECVIGKIRLAIESYAGEVSWDLVEHKREHLPGTNWILAPKRLREVEDIASAVGLTPGQFLAKYEPEFSMISYRDLDGLTRHVAHYFFEEKGTDLF